MPALLQSQTELLSETRAGLSSQPPGAAVSAKPSLVFVSVKPSYLEALQALADLDFRRKTIRVNKSADDLTRKVRQPKTRKSVALLPMPSCMETMLRNYLRHHWRENPNQLLFPAPRKDGFARSRNNVVRSGLKPILRKLGIPAENVGLHAFRHYVPFLTMSCAGRLA